MNSQFHDMKEWPSVSVIICTKDRQVDLIKAIDSVKNVDYPGEKLEIVVVEEADRSPEYEGVKTVFIPRKKYLDFGYPRNLGVKNSKGDIIVFTDDDCIVEKNWLKELVSCFKNDVAAVCGGVLVKDCNPIGYCETVLGFPGGGLQKILKANGKIIPTQFLSTCNCAFQRWVFNSIGYFKEDTPYSGEDFDLARRICKKYTCLYTPHAIVYHKARQNVWKIFRWFNRRGIGEIFLVWMKTNDLKSAIQYNASRSISLRLILLVSALKVIKQNKPSVYIILFVIYYSIVLIRYRFQLKPLQKISTFILTPLVKIVMDFGMDVGRIMGPFVLARYVMQKKRKKNK